MEFKNNSQDMKTVVQTFVIEETAELIYDNEQIEKWKGLVNDLGLQGQENLAKPDKSPIPFMHMNQKLISIAKELCSRDVLIKDYKLTPIPLEILELVSLSIKENYFQDIEIWYDEENRDPFCVGITCQYYTYDNSNNRTGDFKTREEAEIASGKTWTPYKTNEEHYLIGKWADVKHSFKELSQLAQEKFLNREGSRLQRVLKDTKLDIENLEDEAVRRFAI